jgi:heat shock protein HspQ
MKLTLKLLRALDVHLAPKGEGLQDRPLFEKQGILECLVETRNLSFLIGSKPRRKARRNDLSRWDARSLAELLREVSRFDVHMDFETEDVLWRTPMNARRVQAEPWYHLLRDSHRSLVSIGAPLANHASEVLLSKLFGQEAFVPPTAQMVQHARLPFYFAWPPSSTGSYRSAFALTWRELTVFNARIARAVRDNRSSAFVLDEEVYEVKKKDRRWMMYGVIAAQRRSTGNVWVVVSGLTGPATNAASELVKRVVSELPSTPGEDSPVLWVPIRTVVTYDPTRDLGDNREIGPPKFIGKPRIWPEEPKPAAKPSESAGRAPLGPRPAP